MTKLLLGTLTVGAALGAWACTDGPTCGSGTIEMDGQCIAAGTPPTGSCTGNTTFDPGTGACIPKGCVSGKPCGICGDNTTADVAPDGTVTCIGTGTGGVPTCDKELVCPNPATGKFQVCGRIYSAVDTTKVQEDDTLGAKLTVTFYDASALAGTQTGQQPAGKLGTATPDRCGRFTAGTGIMSPSLGFVAIGTDDAGTDYPGGNFIFTAMAVSSAPNGKAQGVRAFSAPQSLATTWGNNIVANGAYMGIFLDTTQAATPDGPFPGKVVPGVKLQFDSGDPEPTYASFYFDDADPLTHTMVNDGATVTGVNGAGIMVGTPLSTTYTGTKTGCTFPELPAATLKNGILVQEVPGTCP